MSVLSAVLVAAVTLVPTTVVAQCSNLLGNPPPQPEQYAANQVKLKYLGTGPGFGDDRPQLKKSVFTAPSLTFDPITTHYVHVTIRTNTISGPIMWTTSIPPSATLWSSTVANGVVKWTFNDPATTYGVRKIKLNELTINGIHVVKQLLGRNTNIGNAPLMPGTDAVHVMVEIEDGSGVGICYDGLTGPCAGAGNTQTCKAT